MNTKIEIYKKNLSKAFSNTIKGDPLEKKVKKNEWINNNISYWKWDLLFSKKIILNYNNKDFFKDHFFFGGAVKNSSFSK